MTAQPDSLAGGSVSLAVSTSADAAGAPLDRQNLPWTQAWAAVIGLSAIAATTGLLASRGHGKGLFVPAVCFGTMLLAAGFDAATARIPNPITYSAILLGIAVNCLSVLAHWSMPALADHWLGAAGPTQAFLGVGIIGGIGLICRALGDMGGGDMKLLAAVGALLGLSCAADVLLCGLAVAVVYGVVNLLLRARLNATVRAAAVRALNMVYMRDFTPAPLPSRKRLPVAVPILVGLILSRLPIVTAAAAWMRGAM